MLFQTKSFALPVLFALIFATLTHAAPAASVSSDEMDLDWKIEPECSTINGCLEDIEQKNDELKGERVNEMDKDEQIEVYRPILRFIDSLTLLVDVEKDGDEDMEVDSADMEEDEEEEDTEAEEEGQYEEYSEERKVRYWIKWQKNIEGKLYGPMKKGE